LFAQNELKLTCRSWVIWYYTFGVNCTKKFNRSHAHLFHFVKDGRVGKFTFNADDPNVRVPSARQLVYADGRANPDGRLPDDTWILRPQDVPNGFAMEQDTWYFPRVAGTFKERAGFHGCQMPEQLLGRIIRISSNPGDRVLDPFGGSGTTLVVAKKLRREYKGFELSKEYAAKIRERLAAVRAGQPLDGSAEPLKSAPTTPRARALDLKSGIIEAFDAARAGFSVDHLLTNPEINQAFIFECQRRSLPGSAVDWNRFLLRLRKSKSLPKFDVIRKRPFTGAELEDFGFASEIALQQLTSRTGLTLDEVLCDPLLAAQFDEIAASYRPGFTPFEYRWAAMTIRKRARTWRRDAEKLKRAFRHAPLQPSMLIETVLKGSEFERPGVYVLQRNDDANIYVGKTQNVARQLQWLAGVGSSTSWSQWKISRVRTAVVPNKSGRSSTPTLQSNADNCIAALQSHWVGRLNPMLNYERLAVRQ